MSWTSERARVASLTRSRAADDPELVAARQRLRAARYELHVQKIIADAPPLTDEQRHRVAQLLAPHIVVGGGEVA